ncbi:MAG: putative hydroxymethylpyrimidine transporter CytX [Ruminococcaceae bacterium]|nr:putative hydroxymethylpyrimidine transporter CytX [Oscillospiraceae bacterium]
MSHKTSIFSNSLIWFGAAVSIAEIVTGTLIAPLGFAKGTTAIFTGHLIGLILMCLTGIIGGKTEKSSMETVKFSFGKNGSLIFSVLNVIQLIGWTAIMIINGSNAANSIFSMGILTWNIIIGGLICLWIFIGLKNMGKINIIAMLLLFFLTILLSTVIFKVKGNLKSFDNITFGAAVELSVAMPLSWLPLISDYTKDAKKPVGSTIASSITYFFASCWMYIIGLGAAIFTGETDIALIMLKSGFGISALLIIVFSTVTTTFLDAYSAGVSFKSIFPTANGSASSIIICILGTLLASFTPILRFENFLYFIGSVFAPMIAILITDYFILNNRNDNKKIDMLNIVIWIIGFIIYRLLMKIDTPLGYTLPAMVIVIVITFVSNKFIKRVTD